MCKEGTELFRNKYGFIVGAVNSSYPSLPGGKECVLFSVLFYYAFGMLSFVF